MTAMNYSRTAIGGMAATVVLFAGGMAMIAAMHTEIMAERSAAHMPSAAPAPLLGLVEMLSTGFLIVWIYAAIRPRFGAGMVTAMRSGLVVWVATVLLGTIHIINDNFGFSASLLVRIAAAMLPAFVAAGIAGGWAYRE